MKEIDKCIIFLEQNGWKPVNYNALIRMVIEYRQIDCNYRSIK
jgi:hypothetical protein